MKVKVEGVYLSLEKRQQFERKNANVGKKRKADSAKSAFQKLLECFIRR